MSQLNSFENTIIIIRDKLKLYREQVMKGRLLLFCISRKKQRSEKPALRLFHSKKIEKCQIILEWLSKMLYNTSLR